MSGTKAIEKRSNALPLRARPHDPALRLPDRIVPSLLAPLSYFAFGATLGVVLWRAGLLSGVWAYMSGAAAIGVSAAVGERWSTRLIRPLALQVHGQLQLGRADAAVRAVEARLDRIPLRQRPVALMLLARARAETGDLEGAIELFGEVCRCSEGNDPRLTRASAIAIADCYAILGDRDNARRCLDWVPEGASEYPATAALVHCRFGEWDAVGKLRRCRRRDELEVFLTGQRQLDLLKAFAQAQLGAQDLTVLLARARPRYPNQHALIARHWPELQAFLEDHRAHLLAPPLAQLPAARVVKK